MSSKKLMTEELDSRNYEALPEKVKIQLGSVEDFKDFIQEPKRKYQNDMKRAKYDRNKELEDKDILQYEALPEELKDHLAALVFNADLIEDTTQEAKRKSRHDKRREKAARKRELLKAARERELLKFASGTKSYDSEEED